MTSTNADRVSDHLPFKRPSGLPAGPLLATALTFGLIGWMATGQSASPAVSLPPPASATNLEAQSVRAIASAATHYLRTISVEGETLPSRTSFVTARVPGIVDEILASKGDRLAMGDPIARLSSPGLQERIAEAIARRDEARRALDNAEALSAKGLTTDDRLASDRTAFASAVSALEALEIEREDLVLRAPFSGVLDALDIEVGDNIRAGDQAGQVVDMSAVRVSASVPQKLAGEVEVGVPAKASLATGIKAEGWITYVATVADPSTRSFPIEVTLPNPDGTLKAGVSTSLSMKGEGFDAHLVPTAYLSLSADGEMVVKTVEDDRVRMWPVTIVGSTLDEVYVTGLPDEATIITVGQGFVSEGDLVEAEVQS